MNPCVEIMERFRLCLAVQHTSSHARSTQTSTLAPPFLPDETTPPMGSGAGWIQEEDGGVH